MLQTEDRLFLCSLLASWTEMDGLGCRAAGVLGHFINEDRGDETSFEPGAPTSWTVFNFSSSGRGSRVSRSVSFYVK